MTNFEIYSLLDILPIQNKLSFVCGSSGTGKTAFIKQLLSYIDSSNVYIFCQDWLEWEATKYSKISTENPVDNLDLFDQIPSSSIVILDDYFHSQSSKSSQNFREIVNFKLRHNEITLICLIHQFTKVNLYSVFILCENIFITYSKVNLKVLFQIFVNYGIDFRDEFNSIYSEGQAKYYVGYLNLKLNYFVPKASILLTHQENPISMFKDGDEYLIFKKSDLTIKKEIDKDKSTEPEDDTTEDKILDMVKQLYNPKNQKIIILTKLLYTNLRSYINKENLSIEIDGLFYTNFIDFLKYTQMVNTPKAHSMSSKYLFILKLLKSNNLKIAKTFIKNKKVQSYLC